MDAVPLMYRKWLRSDADIWAAAKALCSSGPAGAVIEYEEAVKSKALIGSYSKQSRAARARRQVINYDDFSDMESGDDEKDPELVIDAAEIVEDESDVEIVDNGSEEKEEPKEAKSRSCLFQAWSKNQAKPCDLDDMEQGSMKAITSQVPPATEKGFETSAVSKVANYVSFPAADSLKGFSVPPSRVSNMRTSHVGSASSQAQNQGVSTCPIFQPVSCRMAKPSSGLPDVRSSSFGTVPPMLGQPHPFNAKRKSPNLSVQQANGMPNSTALASRGDGTADAVQPPSLSQTHRKGRAPKKNTVQDHTAQYVLEYRRLCAAKGIPLIPPTSKRPEHLGIRNANKSASISSLAPAGLSGTSPDDAGLPIGLRKIAPALSTSQTCSLPGSQINGQVSWVGPSGLKSKAASSQVPQGSGKGREMPTLLRKTIPPAQMGLDHSPAAASTSQTKSPLLTKGTGTLFNFNHNRIPPTKPATLGLSQEAVMPSPTSLSRKGVPTVYRPNDTT
ncbi:hypothetical protein FGB62_1g415 [Gracilaria domingensis]|nr:hypothetical protein FGB62_1g415 [Gracilaria domingensis]